jgi:hypothetical protein
MSVTAPLLYSRFEDGHRADYIALFARLLGAGRIGARALVGARGPLLFLMVEEAFWLYVLVTCVRSLLGRRTAGLLLRPLPALTGTTLRLRLKRLLLRPLRALPRVETLTVMPFAVEPRFATIADGWIDDPQQWDLGDAALADVSRWRQAPAGLAAAVSAAAQGRRVLAAPGRQDADKGFDRFARAYAASPVLRDGWLFASAGSVRGDLSGAREPFLQAGGFSHDRQVSSAELLQLYAAAAAVWCCYAPGYDQSSGILGRAMQLGIPVLVRRGSLLQRLCESEGIAHAPVDGAVAPALAGIGAIDPAAGRRLRDRMRNRSVARLRQALALEPPP